jgi:hypothetical protein
MVCRMLALFSMRVSMRTTSSVLTSRNHPARECGREGRGVSQLGASVTMVSHPPRCSCCRVSTARRDTRRRVLQTQFEHATTKNSDSALEVESV